jgi:hypothetical protein
LATSEAAICNSALAKIGKSRINSLSDNTEAARLCAELYPALRDELLRSHPWNFNMARVELAEVSPAPDFEWDHAFQLPTDCARVFSLNNEVEWKVEGTYLMVNGSSTAKIRYGQKITDVTLFDATFCEVLAYRLATDLAYALTQSSALADRMDKKFKESLAQSRSFDGQEGSSERFYADSWQNARF